MNLNNVRLEQALNAIEKQSRYFFVYGDNIDADQLVSISANAKPLEEVLYKLLSDAGGIQYTISNTSIVLSPAAKPQISPGRRISGHVSDQNETPIVGATVVVKGTSVADITKNDGGFTIDLPPSSGATYLSVHFFGYESLELPLGEQTYINIVLKEAEVTIDEVVVTALGIKRSEKALSYNVQQVLSDDIVGVKDASFINALNGKIAGVNINASSAGVGGAVKVVMRGTRAIETSSKALYVIDGVPMANYTRDRSNLSDSPFSSSGTTDMAADINSEDIESISILTGAAAAALYGSAAANGAIIINTKKGVEGATTVTFTQNTEFVTAFVTPEFQNRYGTSTDNRNMSWGSRLVSYNDSGYDPVKDYLKTGHTTTETVSLSTGTSRNQTYLSAAALKSEGIVPNNKYDRYNFTFRNTSGFFRDKMTLNVGAGYVRQRDLNMTNQGAYSNPLASAYLYPRGNDWQNVKMFERYNTQRKISEQFWDMDAAEYVLQNPYWINYRNLRENKKDRFMINASLDYKVLDWLTLSGRASIDNTEDKGTAKYYATTNTQLTEMSKYGLYGESHTISRMLYGDVMANIKKSFGRNWSLGVVVGASIQDDYVDGRNISGPIRDGSIAGETALIPNVFNLHQISNSKTKKELVGWHEQMQSVFASAEAGFMGIYYLTATIRTDWPSQLAGAESAQNSFTYPSVGISVILSEMFRMPRQISYLKIRSSYANVGLSFMRYIANPTYGWITSEDQWSKNRIKAPEDLKPEYTHSFEVGLTSRFLKHFSLDFTFYNTNTINQTINPNISPGSGWTTIYVQQGRVRNRGVEASLGYGNRWNKCKWDTGLTLSVNRNKIMQLGGEVLNATTGEVTSYSFLSLGGLGSSLKFLLQEGGTLGDLYTPLDLVRDHEGKIYVDNNGKIFIDSSNKSVDKWVRLGSIFPKANLNWRNDFAIGNLNFGFLITARFGGIVYSRTQATLDHHGVSRASADARDNGGVSINGGDMIGAYDWYTVIGQSDGLPHYYTYDATNVRLQEASIGYTIPRKWLGDVCDITVSMVGRNLLMFYKRAPFDPEATATVNDNYYQGIDYFMMPSVRSLGFSVRLKF